MPRTSKFTKLWYYLIFLLGLFLLNRQIEDLCGLECWSYLLEGQRQELELLMTSNKTMWCRSEPNAIQQSSSLLNDPEAVLSAFRSSLQRNLLNYTETVHYALQINETEVGLGCRYLCLFCNRAIHVRSRLYHKRGIPFISVHCSSIFKHIRSTTHSQYERGLQYE